MKIREQDGTYRIDKYEGNDVKVVLPEKVEGKPLTVIGAKAFLSCRRVELLELPESIEQIQDWAFAHMKGLRELVIPGKEITFGKKVFLGCENLEQIRFRRWEGIYRGIPYFLASQVRFTNEPPMNLTLAQSEKDQWEWLAAYDMWLLQFLDREDTYGFEPAFIGWFNIQDVDDQQDDFIRARRKCKIALVLQRLTMSEGLKPETKKRLTVYLLDNSESVADMLTGESYAYSHDVIYFKLWQSIGGFQVLSPKELMERMTDGDPEILAFLMDCELKESGAENFFAKLEL